MSLGAFRFYPSGWNMLWFLCKLFLFLCFFKNLPHYWIEAQKKEDSIGSVNAAWLTITEVLKSQKCYKILLGEFLHIT